MNKATENKLQAYLYTTNKHNHGIIRRKNGGHLPHVFSPHYCFLLLAVRGSQEPSVHVDI